MKLCLAFLLTVLTVWASVDVEDGVLRITGYDKCHIDINGEKEHMTLNKTSYSHPGVVYGLIKWKCDDDYGSIIKDIECRKCGIYCAYNQQFTQCKSTTGVIVMGVVTGISIFLLALMFAVIFMKKAIHRVFLKMTHYFLTRNDRARAVRVRKLTTATGSRNNILFRLIITQDEELNKMIMESRMKLRKEITGDEPIYEEICQKEYEANKFSTDLEEKIRKNPHHQMGYNAAKAALLTTMVLTATAPTLTYSCDTTLYLSSSGKVCDIRGCQDTNAYSMQIQTGSKLCFNKYL